MNRTWWAAAVLMAGAATAGCAAPEDSPEAPGLGEAVPPETPPVQQSAEDGTGLGLGYTAPEGECGVSLVCGLGADPVDPTAPTAP